MNNIGNDVFVDGNIEADYFVSGVVDGAGSPVRTTSKDLNENFNAEYLNGHKDYTRRTQNELVTGAWTFDHPPLFLNLSTNPNAAARYDQITGLSFVYVPLTRNITINGTPGRVSSSAGAQSLASDPVWTLDLVASGVGAGTYKSVTVDAYGRVIAGTSPTTVAGFGITDILAQTLAGYALGSNVALTSSDSILSAFQNLQAQVNTKANALSGTGYVRSASGVINYDSQADINYWTKTGSDLHTNGFVGIGGAADIFPIKVTVNQNKFASWGNFSIEAWSTNDVSNPHQMYAAIRGGATQDVRSILFQTWEQGLSFGGVINYQYYGGSVVIGNWNGAAPAHVLEVVGSVSYSGSVRPGGSAGSSGQVLTTNGSSNAWNTLSSSYLSDFTSAGRALISGVGAISYNSSTGQISYTGGAGAGTVGGTGTAGYFTKWSTGGVNIENTTVFDNGAEINFGAGRAFGVEGAAAFRAALHAHTYFAIGKLSNHGQIIVHHASSATINPKVAIDIQSTEMVMKLGTLTISDMLAITPEAGMICYADNGSTLDGLYVASKYPSGTMSWKRLKNILEP